MEQKDAEIEKYKRTVERLETENAALRASAQQTGRKLPQAKKIPERALEIASDDDTFYKADLISSGPTTERIPPFDSHVLQR